MRATKPVALTPQRLIAWAKGQAAYERRESRNNLSAPEDRDLAKERAEYFTALVKLITTQREALRRWEPDNAL